MNYTTIMEELFPEMKKEYPHVYEVFEKAMNNPVVSYKNDAVMTTFGLLIKVADIFDSLPQTLENGTNNIKKSKAKITNFCRSLKREYELSKVFIELEENPEYRPDERKIVLRYVNELITKMQNPSQNA